MRDCSRHQLCVCIHARDVVLFREARSTAVAMVDCNLEIDGTRLSCITPWAHVTTISYATKYRVVNGESRLVRSEMLLEPLIHTVPVRDRVCTALLPLRYR